MEDTTRMVEMKRELEESPSIKLGLAIGGGGGEEKRRRRRSEFTVAQVSELEQQRLIFKYISAGLAPPFHLVLPIYKSVAASLSNVNFYQQYPSFLGHGAFDYMSKMDAEPGRCRRTDGKKWRCSRAIVPDEKYCEKHIHRGRQRSRKPVETSEVTSPLSTKLPKNADDELSNSRKNLQNHTPKGLLVMAQPSNNGSASLNQMTFSSGYHELPMNVSTVAYTSTTGTPYRTAITPAAAAPCTTAGQMITTTSACNDNNVWIGVKDYDSNHHASIIRGTRNDINVGSGFSPKSVLQAGHMILVNCNGLHFDNPSGEELEPGRCRRTDGKKWRCKRDVLPDHKYCDRHVHRGVKQMRSCDPVAAASTSANAVNSNPSQTTCIAGETDSAIPNTNLTMSIPARSPQMQHHEKSNSSCDSDATITDTSVAAYEQLI